MPRGKPKPKKKQWNFAKQGYPPGIDAEWAERERLEIMRKAKKALEKQKTGKKPV